MTPRRCVVAINPNASFGKNRHAGLEVVQALRKAGHDVLDIAESSYEALRASAKTALTPDSVLVVVGGDGMAHLGAGLALDAGVPLGLIPSGTGNDLARHLGLPLGSLPEAIDSLLVALQNPPRTIDLGIATDADGVWTPYVCVLSAGFDAIVNERANTIRFPKGRHRYTLALLIELAKLRVLNYTVSIDGEDLSGQYLLVAVANSQSFGGGMKVTPAAEIDDGVLDVLLLKPLSRLNFLRIYPRVFKGTHVSDPRVIIRRGSAVHIECDGVIAYADGERIGPLPLDVAVRHRALAVLA
jgi:diacylglycerol kinase (ATP)